VFVHKMNESPVLACTIDFIKKKKFDLQSSKLRRYILVKE